jgi:hypothetical protein
VSIITVVCHRVYNYAVRPVIHHAWRPVGHIIHHAVHPLVAVVSIACVAVPGALWAFLPPAAPIAPPPVAPGPAGVLLPPGFFAPPEEGEGGNFFIPGTGPPGGFEAGPSEQARPVPLPQEQAPPEQVPLENTPPIFIGPIEFAPRPPSPPVRVPASPPGSVVGPPPIRGVPEPSSIITFGTAVGLLIMLRLIRGRL